MFYVIWPAKCGQIHWLFQTGTGKPEKLKYGYIGKWSRHISDKHRLIYEIHEEVVTVIVLSTFGHYKDK